MVLSKPEQLALGRTDRAVRAQLSKLQLRQSTRDGWFTARETATILGVSRTWLERELHRGTLQAERYTDSVGATWRITTQALRDYLIENAARLQGRNLQLRTIVDILTGRL
jgi:excisionase family DNA binding protein